MTITVNNNFVQSLYLNVLQRIGTEAEINSWVSRANSGMSAPDIVNSMISSPAGQRVESIIRLYDVFFDRAPDSDGLFFWTNSYNNGATLNSIAQLFGTSPEFQNRYAGVSTASFVEAIYSNLYHRASDAAGKAFWVNQIDNNGMSRTSLALNFTLTPEALLSSAAPTRFADSYLVLRASGNYEPSTGDVNVLSTSTLAQAIAIEITSFDPVHDAAAAAALTAIAAATAAAAAAAAAATAASGQVIALTAGADTMTGTLGKDTFIGSYDGGVATDTFGATDILNGSGGIDTLLINHILAGAITPPDALWTGITNIEKVIINTTTDGVQTVTTGANFQTAFSAAGVDLTVSTSGAGAINITMNTVGAIFTGVASLHTTSLAGAQTILTGSGATTVTANSTGGALTISGVGLATVTTNTSGAGAQTIGDANVGGGGANLVNVDATTNAGAQTITSTSAGTVSITSHSIAGSVNTISATGSGNHTIIGSLGGYTITGGSGVDTITGGTGIDTFAFGANGSVIGISRDIITDMQTTDLITFGGNTALVAADATALVAGSSAGSNVQTTAGGLVIFAAGDNSLALKIAAVQADIQLDVAGTVAMFIDGANTYLYYAGVAAGNADDQLIQLTGVTSFTTITGGATTHFA